jgi:hypothetical protein
LVPQYQNVVPGAPVETPGLERIYVFNDQI